MAGGRRRGRGFVVLIVSAIAVVAVLWVGYWFVARTAALYGIGRLTQSQASGDKIACDGLNVSGFPFYLDLRCNRSAYASANQSVTAAIGGLSASAPLYRPGSVDAQLDAPFVVNIPARGLALTVNWSEANANAAAGLGGLEAFHATFAGLTAANAGGGGSIPAGGASATSASLGIGPGGGNSLALTGAATSWSSNSPTGAPFRPSTPRRS